MNFENDYNKTTVTQKVETNRRAPQAPAHGHYTPDHWVAPAHGQYTPDHWVAPAQGHYTPDHWVAPGHGHHTPDHWVAPNPPLPLTVLDESDRSCW